jgi:hypothetical protein
MEFFLAIESSEKLSAILEEASDRTANRLSFIFKARSIERRIFYNIPTAILFIAQAGILLAFLPVNGQTSVKKSKKHCFSARHSVCKQYERLICL